MNKKTDKKLCNPGWGGHREKSGRKSTWNHVETTTIRIPKAEEQEVMRYARDLDAKFGLDNETDLSVVGDDFVIESNFPFVATINDEFDYETDSIRVAKKAMKDYYHLETETESRSKYQFMPSFMNAIFLAREILKQKKCARISLATFISKFYSTHVNSESLKSYD